MLKNFIMLFFVVMCIAPVALTTGSLMGDEVQWEVMSGHIFYAANTNYQDNHNSSNYTYEWNPDTGEITAILN